MKALKIIILTTLVCVIAAAYFYNWKKESKAKESKEWLLKTLKPLPSLSAKGLTLTAELRETGLNDGMDKDMPSYIVYATLKNDSQKNITYVAWTCNWISSWRFSPPQYFAPPCLACDCNSLQSRTIKPGEEIKFRIPLIANKKWQNPNGIKIKLGFALCDPQIYKNMIGKENTEETMIWSNYIILPKVTSGPRLKLWNFKAEKMEPNKTPQRTTMPITDSAAQPPRQS